MSTLMQGDQVVIESAQTELSSAARDNLNTIIGSLNNYLKIPCKVTLNGNILVVQSSEVTIDSNGKIKSLPPISNIEIGSVSGAVNVNTGAVSGDFIAPSLPSMTASNYIKAGIELRSDKKFYLVFGTQNAAEASATVPTFTNGAYAVGHIVLQDNGSGGTGNFSTPSYTKLRQYSGSGAGGGSGSGTGKNYLADWYDAERPIGTIENSVGNTDASSTRATPNNWGASNTSNMSITTTSTSLRGSQSYITTGSGSDSAGAVFIESPLFTLDNFDLGQPLSISISMNNTSNSPENMDIVVARYNSSNVLQEKISVSGPASGGTPKSSSLSLNKSFFGGFFLPSTTATDKYAIRIRRLSASGGNITLEDISVGPFTSIYGAAAESLGNLGFTPNNFGSTTNHYFSAWRIGNIMRVIGRWDNGTVAGSTASLSLPSGYDIDSTLLSSSSRGLRVGEYQLTGGANAIYGTNPQAGTLFYDGSDTTKLYFCIGSGVSSNTLNKDTASTASATSAMSSVQFDIPIATWQSNVKLANRSLEEYASNSSTSDADDTTSFVYGAAGGTYPGTLTTARRKRVRFKTPIQPTDVLTLEFSSDGKAWSPMSSGGESNTISIAAYDAAANFGVALEQPAVNSTDINALFLRYSSGTQNWSTSAGYWRVRKVASGASVGFPISVANLYDNLPTIVRYDSFNPSDVSGTNTNASARTIIQNSTAISVSTISSGTVTYTFNVAGFYKVNMGGAHTHANTYTVSNLYHNVGGTASLVGSYGFSNVFRPAGSGSGSQDVTGADFVYVSATAGQTLTVQVQFNVVGAGVAANHTGQGMLSIQKLN